MNDKKQEIINEYFNLTGDKLTHDDPIVALMLYFSLKAEKALSDNVLNENLSKFLHEANQINVNLSNTNENLDSIQLNRLQIVNELSALNKAQIFKEIKESLAIELKEKQNNKSNNIFMWISFISTFLAVILAIKVVFLG